MQFNNLTFFLIKVFNLFGCSVIVSVNTKEKVLTGLAYI